MAGRFQSKKSSRRFYSRKPRRNSNEGDYLTDAELQLKNPPTQMFDPSVLKAILHGTNPMDPVIPQLDAHPVHKALNEPSQPSQPSPPSPPSPPPPAEIYIQPIPVPGLQKKIHTTKKHRKKHRLNSNKTKTQKSNIPQPIKPQPIKYQRFSSVPPIPSGLPKPIEQSKPTRGVEWHEGKLISKSTGEVLSSSSYMHGKSGSNPYGRGHNSQAAKNGLRRRARGRGH